jgi:hypothetical protein
LKPRNVRQYALSKACLKALEVSTMKTGFLRILIALAALLALPGVGHAQNNPSPRELQGLIAAGQDKQALAQLQNVLAAHPDSAVAWYLSAEAQDALGHEDAARSALAKAEKIAPGLPFANPADAQALQTHLNAGAGDAPSGGGMGSMIFVVGALVVLFLVVRVFLRSRRRVMPGLDGYGRPMGYGPGGQGFAPPGYGQPGYGGGSGIGGSLIGGLAAGAGFAAGERIIDDLSGNRDGGQGYIDPNFQGGAAPDRDDGLQGDPGWDDNSGGGDGGGFDSGNSW